MRVVLLALATVALVGCGEDSTDPPLAAPPDVLIVSDAVNQGANAYDPNSLTVSLTANPSVKWRNNDPTVPGHTVTSTGGPLNSGLLADGETYSFTFTAQGVYDYHCTVHPGMVGTIIVNP